VSDSLDAYLVLAGLLFAIGTFGFLARRNAISMLMSIELMLNAVNINLVAFAAMLGEAGVAGQVFALFVITVAAAEVGVGLAVVILIYRNRQSVDLDELSLMKW
jgi:NADH:ubiquinone oxidoreductase subunit K